MLELNCDEYWANDNDSRDTVRNGDIWCKDGDEFDKASLLDQYMDINPLSQCVKDLQGDQRGSASVVWINNTATMFKWAADTYKSKRWQKFVVTFGKARLWDELVCRIYGGTDTMMARLGYRWVSNEEE